MLWAVAKVQLELAEEVYPHQVSVRSHRLAHFFNTTQIPPPPVQPFEWPGAGHAFDSDAWYYYLAESSSRRLVERIKKELYNDERAQCNGGVFNEAHSGFSTNNDRMHYLSAVYPLACELERQVHEW